VRSRELQNYTPNDCITLIHNCSLSHVASAFSHPFIHSILFCKMYSKGRFSEINKTITAYHTWGHGYLLLCLYSCLSIMLLYSLHQLSRVLSCQSLRTVFHICVMHTMPHSFYVVNFHTSITSWPACSSDTAPWSDHTDTQCLVIVTVT